MTLTEFLLARIAEDEERAHLDLTETPRSRVLAECEAKRRIVDLVGGGPDVHRPRDCQDCDVMRALALPYADHPDYREEWA